MDTAIAFLARWIHIASAVTVLGGMLFAVLAWLPGLQTAPEADQQRWSDAIAAKYRPWFLAGVVGLLASGLYNYLRHAQAKDVPTMYHMIFGMKFLLALHVFTVGYLALRRGNAKRARQITGVVLSGLVILVLSVWMRYLVFTMLQPVPVVR
jgi:uncharacterized membrane protein